MSLLSLGAAVSVGAVGCLGQEDSSSDTSTEVGALLGDALPGTNGTTFAAAKANFVATESAADGLGPIFNQNACASCHQNGSTGGAGQNIEQRYGTITNGTFNTLASTGGSLRQLFGIGGFNVGGVNCNSGVDNNPAAGATLFSGRLTTPLFGLGLVDSLPDSVFSTLASREPAAVRGAPRMVPIALPNPLDGSQVAGGTRVGRFGWKANVPSLAQFSADAYLNEMGITTTSCIHGTSNTAFATENRANRAGTNAIINGCPDDQVPGVDDDLAAETNHCAGGLTELEDDVANFTFFMAHLAPPPQVAITAGTAQDRGRTLFNSSTLMCSSCHRSDTDIFVSTSAGGVPAGIKFQPFSDFLVHDMGTAADQIGLNDGDSVASTRLMRTAPLWGLRSRNLKFHDGRTSDIGTAIKDHNGGSVGQGTAAATAFGALSSSQQSDLVSYLNTL
ncbi:MAG TPA: di-heme oxidoredictase family protein [Polyangia bacterium]|nr:di-heme oxidoredictase family protein [Polyangia bacterium]